MQTQGNLKLTNRITSKGGTWLNKCEDSVIKDAVAIASKYIVK